MSDIITSILREVERGEGSSIGDFSILEKVTLGKNTSIGNYSQLKDVVVGEDSKVWHYCNLYGCSIGRDTQIGSFTEIKPEARVGDSCRFQAYVFIPEGTCIGNNVFIGPKVTFLNDRYPTVEKTVQRTWKLEAVVVEDEAVIGGGVILAPGIRIGRNARIGAGSVVTRDVPSEAVVYGNPAHFIGWIQNEKYREWR